MQNLSIRASYRTLKKRLLGLSFAHLLIVSYAIFDLLVLFILSIEFLFYYSKLSFLQTLGTKELVNLFFSMFSLLAFPGAMVLAVMHLLFFFLRRSNCLKLYLFFVATHLLVMAAVFGIVNYFYVDRWLYSAHLSSMISRATWVNASMFVLFGFLGVSLLCVNFNFFTKISICYKKAALSVLFLINVAVASSITFACLKIDKGKNSIVPLSQSSRPTTPPNIVFLTYDMFELTHSPLTKYFRNTTPYLLSKKDEFLIFANTSAISNDSASGFAAIMTGKSPATTHLFSYPDVLRGVNMFQHLPGILKDFGYETINFSSEPYTVPYNMNLLDGFSEINSSEATHLSNGWFNQLRYIFPIESMFLYQFLSRYLERTLFCFGASANFSDTSKMWLVSFPNTNFGEFKKRLESAYTAKKKPFFIHFHSVITHQPIMKALIKRFSVRLDDSCPENRSQFKDCDGRRLSSSDLTDLYDDSLLQLDQEISEVDSIIDRYNAMSSTILIISTDHEYNWSTTGHPVALIMRIPWLKNGRTITQRTWLLDVAPTVLDLIGLSPPEWMEGSSLKPLMGASSSLPFTREDNKSRMIHIFDFREKEGLKNFSVIRGDKKLTRVYENKSFSDALLFDLSKNPDSEESVIVNSNDEEFKALKDEADRIILRISNANLRKN